MGTPTSERVKACRDRKIAAGYCTRCLKVQAAHPLKHCHGCLQWSFYQTRERRKTTKQKP